MLNDQDVLHKIWVDALTQDKVIEWGPCRWDHLWSVIRILLTNKADHEVTERVSIEGK